MTPADRKRAPTHLEATSALSRFAGELSDGTAERIAVVLGCFDALVSRGLALILREDRSLRVIDTDLENAALERAVARRAPRVAILDETAVIDLSILGRLREAQPAIGLVVLAHQPTLADGMRLFATGASCLSKDVSAVDILAAVQIAADGRRVFAPGDDHVVERSYPADAPSLTPREAEVLEYLSRRQSHAEIAHAMQISAETARTHSAHIRGKLGVSNNRELAGIKVPVQSEREIR